VIPLESTPQALPTVNLQPVPPAALPKEPHRPLESLIPPLASMLVHLVAFIVLAMTVVARWHGNELNLLLAVSAPLDEEQLRGLPMNSPVGLVPDKTGPASDEASAVPDLLPIPSPLASTMAVSMPVAERYAAQPLDQVARNIPNPLVSHESAMRARLSEAADVERALGGVLGEIDGRLESQDLLVVWLFDASLSLSADRRQITERLTRFFAQHEDRSDTKKPLLMNAAVAFGSTATELEPPTRSGKRIVEAIGRVQNDVSGVENVFAAVKWAVDRYHRRKGHLMLVVWTDESGDDARNLDAVVQTCARYKVSVSVVGPTSVLGRVYGRQTMVISGRALLLPVNRGPDTPVAERLQLPYWFDTVFPVWGDDGSAMFSQLPLWYGGQQLEHLLCGMGPYSLVRLTVATGGTYTLLDRPVDRCPFRLEIMRPYLPGYPSAAKYQEEIRYHALRAAVAKAVEATLQKGDWRVPPQEIVALQTAALKDELAAQQGSARQCLAVIEKALAAFGREGMEKEYAAEASRRWRAWYDLTRGRLLAGLVRYTEYELQCAELVETGKLGLNTNAVTFFPATSFRGGQPSQDAAAEAKRLLKRCLLENAKTPWAYLAARELDHAMGITVQLQAVPIGPPGEPRGKPGRPRSQPTPPRL
jgi:hypothetical protein